MTTFTAVDEGYEARVRASFARQRVMATIGARLVRVGPGEVDILLPCDPALGQQHGFVHAGIVATIGDSACGYAAFSLMEPDAGVLTVEYKINLLAPARGEQLVARGRVIRRGRTITVCRADVTASGDGGEELVATLLATIMAVRNRPGVAG